MIESKSSYETDPEHDSCNRRDTYVVEYHAYDPRLPDAFERVKRLIQTAAKPVLVEHVGSSSIPGVGGRNVLDIAVSAAELKHADIREAMYALGFEDSPFPHYLPLLVGQLAHEGENYQILLYIVLSEVRYFGRAS